ncbi:MAG TPA: urate oxidase [Streptosporangiaceae bacterium]|nr:urate oxidase [Streptosporangiaceae bacterium]
MDYALDAHQYGKAETRLVRIYRDTARHQIRDLNVSTSLRGDFAAAYLDGDQANVLPTDSQKNTAYAFALEPGVTEIETYALALARHFTNDIEPVHAARVEVDEYLWERARVPGGEHPHAFVRASQEVRTTTVTVEGRGREQRAWVLSGLRDLVLLKSTGSEFAGFLHDRYTTLAETDDRVLATSLIARWRHMRPERDDRAALNASIRQLLIEKFATVHSRALQQSLFQMGKAVLAAHEDIAEIRLSAPNKHHFLVDLSPFGLDNRGEVFRADDRPYGLIQCAVQREDAPPAGPAWDSPSSFAG